MRALLLAIAFASGCSSGAAYLTTPQKATWDFIESAGGIRIGQPRRQNGANWVLPVVCDISGLKTVTKPPTVMRSGVVVTKMLYEIKGHDINIAAVFAMPISTDQTSACQSITLAGIRDGEYQVLYRDKLGTHALGLVTLQ